LLRKEREGDDRERDEDEDEAEDEENRHLDIETGSGAWSQSVRHEGQLLHRPWHKSCRTGPYQLPVHQVSNPKP